jgi:acyl carrier protein
MSDQPNLGGAQFRADRPNEQEAVRTTIVGGRPPGSGQKIGPVPRGIEILLRKASVDPEFRELLLRDRAAAADTIGLKLEPGEAMMLFATPATQLEAIIARTRVPQEHRRAFLGQAAAAMLAVVGAATSALAQPRLEAPGGVRPPTAGIPPDRPPAKEKTVAERVTETIARSLKVDAEKVKPESSLTKDLGANPETLTKLREDLAKTFNIKVPAEDFKKLDTVADTIKCVEKALELKNHPPATQGIRPDMPPGPPVTKGIRPDMPPGSRGIQPDMPPPPGLGEM